MSFDINKFKKEAIIVPDPTPYKKKSEGIKVKKSNHKHEWEPVILTYFNKWKDFSHENGFIGGIDSCRGRRCTYCGKLKCGFPEGFEEEPFTFYSSNQDYRIKYPNLPSVPVEDIWKL